MRIQVQKLGQLTIPAMSQFERFQAGVAQTLLFVEQNVEQEDGRLQLLGRNLQSGRIHQGGDRLDTTTCQELSAADDRVAGAIEIKAGDELASDPALFGQVMERVLHFDM